MYYKLINRMPHRMVMPVKIENGLCLGNSREVIINAGYKSGTAPSGDGMRAVPYCKKTETSIKQLWRLMP